LLVLRARDEINTCITARNLLMKDHTW